MSKKYWKDTYEYKRILEILDDYWLTEKDEYQVEVSLHFVKADGQEQDKCIWWQNPNLDWEICERAKAHKAFNWYRNQDFKNYVLKEYLGKDEPNGDFARDLAKDDTFPRNVDHDTMKRYLKHKNACTEVMEIFEELYKEYIN